MFSRFAVDNIGGSNPFTGTKRFVLEDGLEGSYSLSGKNICFFQPGHYLVAYIGTNSADVPTVVGTGMGQVAVMPALTCYATRPPSAAISCRIIEVTSISANFTVNFTATTVGGTADVFVLPYSSRSAVYDLFI